MVLVPIARELLRQSFRTLGRYYNLESKAFNKLYTGFPRSRLVGRGVRHGLTAGSIAGTFINTAEDTPGNGIQTPFRKQYTPSKPYQTRRGFPIRSGYRNYKLSKFGKRERCPSPGKYFRSNYRFNN